jgi:hypothetical protein
VSAGIFTAYLELNGTRELDLILAEAPSVGAEVPRLEAAIASSRWATGFSQ